MLPFYALKSITIGAQFNKAQLKLPSASSPRLFLFLQGVSTPFFPRLADALQQLGHRVYRINFNVGDRAKWGLRRSLNFRQPLGALPEFLDTVYARYGITDQIMFGDQRPIHQPAVQLAPTRNVRTHVFEEGYFRPYWVTLERGGVNGASQLPRNPDWYRQVGQALPATGKSVAFNNPFWKRAVHDVLYHGAGMLNPVLFPHYRTHAPVPAPVEYAGFLKRQFLRPGQNKHDLHRIMALVRSGAPFYFLPLQLNSDAQILRHSRFNSMSEVLQYVMKSFAAYAPANAVLLVKNHPFDIGQVDYAAQIKQEAAQLGLAPERVVYVETGPLSRILSGTQGVVTVNSTTGALALEHGCPVMALSDPIYALPGLTFQGGLDDFWHERPRPDAFLFRCFRDTVIHTTQINGGFYSSEGINMIIRQAVPQLLAEVSPLEALL